METKKKSNSSVLLHTGQEAISEYKHFLYLHSCLHYLALGGGGEHGRGRGAHKMLPYSSTRKEFLNIYEFKKKTNNNKMPF